MTERGMQTTSAVHPDSYGAAVTGATVEAPSSSVAWAAITGGAFAAASSTVILVALGSGVGLASISPWPNLGATATTFTVMTAIWLIVVQWLSAGLVSNDLTLDTFCINLDLCECRDDDGLSNTAERCGSG